MCVCVYALRQERRFVTSAKRVVVAKDKRIEVDIGGEMNRG